MATSIYEIQNLKKTMDGTNKILQSMLASLTAPIGESTTVPTTADTKKSKAKGDTKKLRPPELSLVLREHKRKNKVLSALYKSVFFRPLLNTWIKLSNLKIVGAFTSAFQRTSSWLSSQFNAIIGEFGEFVELFKGGAQFLWDTAKGIGELGVKAFMFPIKTFFSIDWKILKEEKKHTKYLKEMWTTLTEGVSTGYKRITLKLPKFKRKAPVKGEGESDNTLLFVIMALVASAIAYVGKVLYEKWGEMVVKWNETKKKITDMFDKVKKGFDEVIKFVSGMWANVVNFFKGVKSFLQSPVSEKANKVGRVMSGVASAVVPEAEASQVPQTSSTGVIGSLKSGDTVINEFRPVGNRLPQLTVENLSAFDRIEKMEGGVDKSGRPIFNLEGASNAFGPGQIVPATARAIQKEFASEGINLKGGIYTRDEIANNPDLAWDDIRWKYWKLMLYRHMQWGKAAHERQTQKPFDERAAQLSNIGQVTSEVYAMAKEKNITMEEAAKLLHKSDVYENVAKFKNKGILGDVGSSNTVDQINSRLDKTSSGSTRRSGSISSTGITTSTSSSSGSSSGVSPSGTTPPGDKKNDSIFSLITGLLSGSFLKDIVDSVFDPGQVKQVAEDIAALGVGKSEASSSTITFCPVGNNITGVNISTINEEITSFGSNSSSNKRVLKDIFS